MPTHKTQVYDGNTRVPMLVRGPGVAAGTFVDGVTSHSDIAPTLIDLAGGAVPDFMDGSSFAPQLLGGGGGGGGSGGGGSSGARQATLVEYWSIHNPVRMQNGHATDSGNNTHRAIRIVNATHNLLFAEFTDDKTDYDFERVEFRELFDVNADPNELHNLCVPAAQPRCVVHAASTLDVGALSSMLHAAYACQGGAACRSSGV